MRHAIVEFSLKRAGERVASERERVKKEAENVAENEAKHNETRQKLKVRQHVHSPVHPASPRRILPVLPLRLVALQPAPPDPTPAFPSPLPATPRHTTPHHITPHYDMTRHEPHNVSLTMYASLLTTHHSQFTTHDSRHAHLFPVRPTPFHSNSLKLFPAYLKAVPDLASSLSCRASRTSCQTLLTKGRSHTWASRQAPLCAPPDRGAQ